MLWRENDPMASWTWRAAVLESWSSAMLAVLISSSSSVSLAAVLTLSSLVLSHIAAFGVTFVVCRDTVATFAVSGRAPLVADVPNVTLVVPLVSALSYSVYSSTLSHPCCVGQAYRRLVV